ncbi:MAG: DNA replication/repair protein RecF, partial [Chloroflexota bacterium]|nr:DNA replication/repair protein RecF [Chloroflexota bacterium]
ERLEIDLPSHLIVLQGDNAQGKTNLLEAMYFLTTAKSHRASAERELLSWAAPDNEPTAARIVANVQTTSGELRVEIALSNYSPSSEGQIQKRIKVNGVPRRAFDLIGQVSMVMFTSQDIELIDGSPSRRRRYLDIAISQVDRRYLRALQRYNKVLAQRNQLLKLIAERRADEGQLGFWNGELVEHGSYIIEQRRAMIDELNGLAPPIHSGISGGESLKIDYMPSVDAGGFRERLREIRSRELAQRMSLIGPHRDDLAFMVNDADMNPYGSRGQQRTVALSLKLAEAAYLRAKIGDEPVILFDDVLSELDSARRHRLMEAASAYRQVIITTTDIDYFEPEFLANATRFRVSAGTVAAL